MAEILSSFHPIVRKWFKETFGKPSDPQRMGWPAIASGRHTLILAPTGTGKTLAAFLWELNDLIERGADGALPNGVQLVYISPLKALNNDIQRNLERPLSELRERFAAAGKPFPEIRIGVRTGDTPPAARARMLRKSPHILITTPESLNIMLTSVRGRGMFNTTRLVIVDEIHAIAGTKRGAHLALTLERLERLTEESPQRIGLSATQRPLDEVARYLGGCETGVGAPKFRDVAVVDCGTVKQMELSIETPVADLGNVGGTIWPAVAQLVLRHIRSARTTLVFVNNRAQAEKIAARVNALAEEEIAMPYHGSLSRERRFLLEERLKAGALPALVTTSSLELGIDIGSVDLVIQLQSPKRVASALQRIGRSGHALGLASRGVFVPTFRDDAMEIVAIVAAMKEGDVEPTRVVQNALDVLAQSIVAAVSVDDWKSDGLFDLIRRAYPYHAITRRAFDEILEMLSGKYPSDLAAELEARITWDRLNDRLTGSRAARMTAVISGGTIPDRGLYTVNLPDRTRLGELDEEFVHETRIGDVFQLGSSTWRVTAIEHDRVVVIPAPGTPARMPFWHGEFMARSLLLSHRVGALRRALAQGAAPERIVGEYAADAATATSLIKYVAAQRASTGVVPDDENIVIESFRDETGAVRIIIHAAFGGRVTAPWGMALAQRVRDALRTTDLQVQTTDDGIMLRLPDLGSAPPLDALLGISGAEAEQLVMEEVGATSLFGARFRMNAARALLLPRGNPRRRMPLWLQRLKSLDLLQTVRQFPSFPILVETYREVLQEAFDMAGLKAVLGDIADGKIRTHFVRTEVPSPFAASLQFGFVMDWMYGDDTPRAEQQAALLSLDRGMLGDLMGTEGADDLTLEAMAQVLAERRGTAEGRRARTADELAALIDRAGDVTKEMAGAMEARSPEAVIEDPFGDLLASGRVIGIRLGADLKKEWRFVLTETFPRYLSAFGAGELETVVGGALLAERSAAEAIPEFLRHAAVNQAAARREILARHLTLSGPVTVDEIQRRYGWDESWIEDRLSEWERTGKLLQGKFRAAVDAPEWCSRRVVEIARRRALAGLRKQIEAVELSQFQEFLQRWQHLDARDRLVGPAGVAQAVRQLYGIARPAAGWDRDYLRSRVAAYEPGWLSEFVSGGEPVWVGEGKYDPDSGAIPLARLRFFERGTGRIWIAPRDEVALSPDATAVKNFIAVEGASFIADIQGGTALGTLALREAIRELVAWGLVTNDSVEAMREVARWKPMSSRRAADPARWLPSDYSPSPDRKIVQRRPNLRRLPKWRRPDKGGAAFRGWTGRWSLVERSSTLGPVLSEEELTETVGRQWLARYGIVSRDWWRRERPPIGWRAIYRELKRLEFRGEVRRGYFVKGLAGAQFALPEAVEMLRAGSLAQARDLSFVVMAASDPANVYTLPLETIERDPLGRPRGSGALLVTSAGRVALSVEGRGKRIVEAGWLSDEEASSARAALAEHLRPTVPRR
ncbi:MAG: DEAD/DEAH box helicase [Gemmatimonadota bacterium]|nr:DEAD/DEAH box helicase [Gemmatimonadota bacterium]